MKRESVAAAFARIPRLGPALAARIMKSSDVLILDLRNGTEIALSGRIKGAMAVPFDLLCARADKNSPEFDPIFLNSKTILLYCGSGAHAALAGMMLRELGYDDVFNLGAFKQWSSSGGAIETG